MKLFLKSLKFRMILLVILVTCLPIGLLSFGTLKSYEYRAISIRESEVLSQTKILANQIAASTYIEDFGWGSPNLQGQISMLTNIYDGRVIVINSAYDIISDTYNLDVGKTILSEEVIRSFSGESVTVYDKKYHYIEMTVPIVDPEDSAGTVQGVMLVSVSTDTIVLNKSYLRSIVVLMAVSLCLIVSFLGILFVLGLCRPLAQLSGGIAKMKDEYGEELLEVNQYSETAEISANINKMRKRMRVMDASRQEFVANVSHELKTPMASIKVLADSLNSVPDAPKEMYQEFMADITGEIERETKIINDLLSLVKMDKHDMNLNIASVNINALLETILKRLRPIADRQGVELVLESFRPVTADVDEVKLSLAFTNLIENAIKYNRDDGTGWVHVSLNADHQYFYFKVEDSGIGIPEDSMDRIYERFYRVDKSHSREIGGTGLGLAITRRCILIHKGDIKAHSIPGEGTTFDVRIPLNYIVNKR